MRCPHRPTTIAPCPSPGGWGHASENRLLLQEVDSYAESMAGGSSVRAAVDVVMSDVEAVLGPDAVRVVILSEVGALDQLRREPESLGRSDGSLHRRGLLRWHRLLGLRPRRGKCDGFSGPGRGTLRSDSGADR